MQPQSFSNRPSISTFIEEQRKYSAQQISKIQQSNRKLDQLQEKMKSLLDKGKHKDMSSKQNFTNTRDFVYQQPDSDQVNRYFESSKKQSYQYDFANDIENQDLLLDNHGQDYNERSKKNLRHFSITQKEYTKTLQNTKQANKDKGAKRQKSTGSLKIFKKPNKKTEEDKSIANDKIQGNLKYTGKNSKSISFVNQQLKNVTEKNSKQISKFSPLSPNKRQKQQEIESMVANLNNMIHPHSDIYQINQLELIMQKSLQIKQKQLVLAEQELKSIQEAKVQEYRKNMELQIHLENVKRYRRQISLMTSNSQLIKLPHTDPEMQILCEEVIKEKTELQRVNETLLNELRQLEDEEYKLKLDRKKNNFQLNSQQREFQKILKTHTKRLKENIPQNHQKSLNQQEDSVQRLLSKRYLSNKAFKTHKKHSSSTIQPKQSTQYKYENYLQPQSIKTKRSSKPLLSKSKQKLYPNNGSQTSLHRAKISKSISFSGMNHKNRHAYSGCQAQYNNCGTDKVLIDMVHELDKLKDIVNKQIVKTRSKKSQRKIVQFLR